MSGRANARGRRRGPRRLNLRKTLFVLPNLVTLASVFCGFNAVLLVAQDNPSTDDFYRAAILLMFAMLFDLLDGRLARMSGTESAFGLQLDSLADIVSFGVAPSVLVYKWVLFRYGLVGMGAAFLFTAAGAVRLARFNVLNSSSRGAPVHPGKYIVGLPIPPAAGVLISLLLANHAVDGALADERYTSAILAVTVLLSLFMVSAIRFRSFKDLKFNATAGLLVLFAIGSSLLVWQYTEPQFVLLWLLAVYLFIGVFEGLQRFLLSRVRREQSPSSIPTRAHGE